MSNAEARRLVLEELLVHASTIEQLARSKSVRRAARAWVVKLRRKVKRRGR